MAIGPYMPGGVSCVNPRHANVPEENLYCGHVFGAVSDEVLLDDIGASYETPPEIFCPSCQYALEHVNW